MYTGTTTMKNRTSYVSATLQVAKKVCHFHCSKSIREYNIAAV